MKTASQLLNAYLDNIQNPAAAAALFADDGVLELPTLGSFARAVGPAAIADFIGGLLKKVPDFRFKDVKLFIDNGDQAFGEYSVEALVPSTGKLYKQTYAGVLLSKDGKIQLLREALDTLAAAQAFSPD
ncbi:nuclear transport factor 2 family protein [Duganella sp. FT80W]|uniref:Nuclear transport factor 2 family protein n=1 Tax=Duganella guangzhouensis TaxID=2666084 RepID=A0A6I2KYK3_9BURK|nr:nuclear transport factor 2 family protein [Duganella guangzhouensis]MRW89524.1 nuclear transport factor 2 family protein [Duganella guangzhouensis]